MIVSSFAIASLRLSTFRCAYLFVILESLCAARVAIGYYAINLVNNGFDVTGIDISPTAIKNAKEKAEEKKIKCNFIVADVLGDLDEVKDTFDFVHDWFCCIIYIPNGETNTPKSVTKILNSVRQTLKR